MYYRDVIIVCLNQTTCHVYSIYKFNLVAVNAPVHIIPDLHKSQNDDRFVQTRQIFIIQY